MRFFILDKFCCANVLVYPREKISFHYRQFLLYSGVKLSALCVSIGRRSISSSAQVINTEQLT